MSFLEQLSELAPILSYITILIALIFGIIQLNQFKQQRKDIAAVEVMRSMQTKDFTDALIEINKLPNGISRKEVHKSMRDIEPSIFIIGTTFETLGYLVYRKIIPIEFVEQLVGGECIRIWDKLSHYTTGLREEEGNPILLEWFEWLSFQLKKRDRHNAASALNRFKNWN